MPDLNSLPPSQTPSSRSSPTSHHHPSLSPQIPSPLSRSPTNTAPALGPPSTGSPRIPRSPHIERRRSSVLRDWSLNDASGNASSPGSEPQLHLPPHHQRAPSLGELHQELENEQEAQVNRLLAMIRQQQAQIQQSQMLAAQQQQTQHQQQQQTPAAAATTASTTAVASSTPGSSCPPSASHSRPQSQSHSQPVPQQQGVSGSMPPPAPSASSLSRQSSSSLPRGRARTNSHGHHDSSLDWSLPGMGSGVGRDEVAFYQAETAMVQRENQMLKGRIRELERLVQEMRIGSATENPSLAHD